jgi:hypothetical protein
MAIPTPEERLAKQKAMREKLHPPPPPPLPVIDPDEVISSSGTAMLVTPPPKVLRDKKGRWAPGTCPNPRGRPKDALTTLMQQISNRRRIPQFLGEVASGVGKYAKTDIGTRIKAAQIVLSYAYGRPDVYDSDDGAQYREELRLHIKRVVGVRDEDV